MCIISWARPILMPHLEENNVKRSLSILTGLIALPGVSWSATAAGASFAWNTASFGFYQSLFGFSSNMIAIILVGIGLGIMFATHHFFERIPGVVFGIGLIASIPAILLLFGMNPLGAVIP